MSPEGPGGRCCPLGLPFFISRSIARSLPGLSVESPQLPSTRKTPPSLSPLGPAEQGSSPLLSPVLSDAGGAGTDDQEELRHKVGAPGGLAAGGLGSRGWGFSSPETLPPPPRRSGSLCAKTGLLIPFTFLAPVGSKCGAVDPGDLGASASPLCWEEVWGSGEAVGLGAEAFRRCVPGAGRVDLWEKSEVSRQSATDQAEERARSLVRPQPEASPARPWPPRCTLGDPQVS